jgi:hypothetical protein
MLESPTACLSPLQLQSLSPLQLPSRWRLQLVSLSQRRLLLQSPSP